MEKCDQLFEFLVVLRPRRRFPANNKHATVPSNLQVRATRYYCHYRWLDSSRFAYISDSCCLSIRKFGHRRTFQRLGVVDNGSRTRECVPREVQLGECSRQQFFFFVAAICGEQKYRFFMASEKFL